MTTDLSHRCEQASADQQVYRCMGCAALANAKGGTDCSCATRLLFRHSDHDTLYKTDAIDEMIADQVATITSLKAERKGTLKKIAAALRSRNI